MNRSFHFLTSLLLILTAIYVGYLYVHIIFSLKNPEKILDLQRLYHWSQQWILTDHAYLQDTGNTSNTNLYPPFFVILFSCLTNIFSYTSIYLSWTIGGMALFLGLFIILFKQHFPNVNKRDQLGIVLLLFCYMPFYINMTVGQIGCWMALALYATYWLCLQKRFVLAGCLLGLLMNVKLFIGYFIFYCLGQRHYKMLATFVVSGTLFALIPVLIEGDWHLYQGFINALAHIHWYSNSWNASLYGFFARVLTHPQWPWAISSLLLTVGYLQYQQRNNDATLAFGLCICLMLLISPLGWTYYFPCLVPWFLYTTKAASGASDGRFLACLFIFTLSAIPYPLHRSLLAADLHQFIWFCFPLISLLGLTVLTQLSAKSPQSNPLLAKSLIRLILLIVFSWNFVMFSQMHYLVNQDLAPLAFTSPQTQV